MFAAVVSLRVHQWMKSGKTDLYKLSMGAGEPDVENYFKTRIFPDPEVSDVSDRQPMTKHTVPTSPWKYKVSNPVLDMLYGYNRQNAFPDQQAQLISMLLLLLLLRLSPKAHP